RSGTDAREVVPMRTFEYMWARSGYWAMTTTRPGDLPRTVQPESAEQAALGFERVNPPEKSALVWASVSHRWPDRSLPYLGWGNALNAAGKPIEAEAVFSEGTARTRSAVLWNNLAQTRLTLKDWAGARQAAQTALSIARVDDPRWTSAIEDTLHTIEQASRPCATSGSGC
ncbi:MAG TPA: hypothetical protein VFM48_04025, partial [Aquabacterium sp.]|nr:hypothetical protein [Aquabacterium sp.]